jgi:hypothetical protein
MPNSPTIFGDRFRLPLRRPTFIALLVLCVLAGATPPAGAIAPTAGANVGPRIYLSFASDHEQPTPQQAIAPLAPFSFFVVAEGSTRLSAWEARVALPPEVVVKRRVLPGSRNLDVSLVEDNWIVGLGSCVDLTEEGPLVLASYEAVLLSPTDGVITLAASQPSSVTQQVPAWADCSGMRTRAQPFARQRSVLRLDSSDDVAPRSGPSTLFGASPNPFNPNTTIHFRLASSSNAELKIYNLAGRLVRTFDLSGLSAGEHDVVWNGQDDGGYGVASAVYLVQLTAVDQKDTLRIVLLK